MGLKGATLSHRHIYSLGGLHAPETEGDASLVQPRGALLNKNVKPIEIKYVIK